MNKYLFLLPIILVGGTILYMNQKDSDNYINNWWNQGEKFDIENDSSISVLVVGDVGTGTEQQRKVAEKMNSIGYAFSSQLVLSLGNNFKDNGVKNLGDDQWDKKYADIYPQQQYLKKIPYYGLLGESDYKGNGLYSLFQYREHQWKIEDFFWSHTARIDDKRIAFIHIDTNFLAYGKYGNSSEMKYYFKDLGWKYSSQLVSMVEEQLEMFEDYDWIIVLGHHSVGKICPHLKYTNKLYGLFQEYKVDAYLCGHENSLAFKQQDGMGMILSGAGGKAEESQCEKDADWAQGDVYGFARMNIRRNEIEVVFYYADKQFQNWQEYVQPNINRRFKN